MPFNSSNKFHGRRRPRPHKKLAWFVWIALCTQSVVATAQWQQSFILRYFPNAVNYALRYDHNLHRNDSAAPDQAFAFLNEWTARIYIDTAAMTEARLLYRPIPILELGMGGAHTYRFYEIPPLDCERYQCQGSATEELLSAALMGKWRSVFFRWLHLKRWHRVKTERQGFMLVDGPLFGLGQYDQTHQDQVIFGWEPSAKYRWLVFWQHMQTLRSNQHFQHAYLLYSQTVGWSYGLGWQQSSLNQRGLSLILAWDHPL